MIQKFIVTDEQKGERLDLFLNSKLSNINRSTVQKLIDDRQVTINGQASAKHGHKLDAGDKVAVNTAKLTKPSHKSIKLPVIYEDADVMVINKPAGILSHSKGAFNPEATVATFISQFVKDLGGERAGIVHRLDRDTSGVMICAKNQEALSWLQKQFSSRKVKKTYIAVVKGTPEPRSAIIDMPIERNPRSPKTFHTSATGKPATTKYVVIKTVGLMSLLELRPQTGRTHQLRVHLAKIKQPIVGDRFYGGQPADRLYLHAKSLEITLPSKERKIFSTALPEEFNKLLAND